MGWLKNLFSPSAPKATVDKQPLAFMYRSKDGAKSNVSLHNWKREGIYLIGSTLDGGKRTVSYRLDRITAFNDLSYQQLDGFKPPVGSPLNPKRLP